MDLHSFIQIFCQFYCHGIKLSKFYKIKTSVKKFISILKYSEGYLAKMKQHELDSLEKLE